MSGGRRQRSRCKDALIIIQDLSSRESEVIRSLTDKDGIILHINHRGIVAFQLFLFALVAVTIFVELKERYVGN